MAPETQFDIGKWVVHRQYGIGQIKEIEVKPIHGKPTECFVVQVNDGAFWLPLDSIENPRIRPVASQEIIRKVIKNLRRKPGNLEKDKKYWTQQIKKIPPHSDLLTISQLIRDLSAQKAQKKIDGLTSKSIIKLQRSLTT
jgi:RNA polymerase-interacting CarD/CdnL/TRCF family regulator